MRRRPRRYRSRRSWPALLALAALALALLGTVAFAAQNVVPNTNLDEAQEPTTANQLKPAECSSLDLSARYHGSGTVTGAATNDLVSGGAGDDVLDGAGGDDCLLGGGGADQIDGGPGNDVCIGGSGVNTFAN